MRDNLTSYEIILFLTKLSISFIHDIVISTIHSTGFPENYFNEHELDSKSLKGASKIVFLQKLIHLVGVCHGSPLDVIPSKIAAGLEPINTNELLLKFAQAATNKKVNHSVVIKHCLNKGKIGECREMDVNQEEKIKQELTEVEAVCDKTITKTFEEDDNARDCAREIEKKVNRCNGDVKTTIDLISKLISKPKCSTKLLSKPPFRFLHDIIMAVNKATSLGLHEVYRYGIIMISYCLIKNL